MNITKSFVKLQLLFLKYFLIHRLSVNALYVIK